MSGVLRTISQRDYVEAISDLITHAGLEPQLVQSIHCDIDEFTVTAYVRDTSGQVTDDQIVRTIHVTKETPQEQTP